MKLLEIQAKDVNSLKRSENDLSFFGNHSLDLSNEGLTSLIGCPPEIKGALYLDNNLFSDLVGCTAIIGDGLSLYNNPRLTSLHNIHRHVKQVETITVSVSQIKSRVLGLFLIKGLRHISRADPREEWFDIVQTRLLDETRPRRENMYYCQEELIEAELQEYAQI